MDKIFVSCFSLLWLLLFSVGSVILLCGKLGVKQASGLTAGNGIRRCAVASLVTLSDVMFHVVLIFILFDFL